MEGLQTAAPCRNKRDELGNLAQNVGTLAELSDCGLRCVPRRFVLQGTRMGTYHVSRRHATSNESTELGL